MIRFLNNLKHYNLEALSDRELAFVPSTPSKMKGLTWLFPIDSTVSLHNTLYFLSPTPTNHYCHRQLFGCHFLSWNEILTSFLPLQILPCKIQFNFHFPLRSLSCWSGFFSLNTQDLHMPCNQHCLLLLSALWGYSNLCDETCSRVKAMLSTSRIPVTKTMPLALMKRQKVL